MVGLITMADDEGRLRAIPSALIGHIYPYDKDASRHLQKWLDGIERVRIILQYEVNGRPYIAFRHWLRHQKINRPTPSVLPPPPDPAVVIENTVPPSGRGRGHVSDMSLTDHGEHREGSSLPRVPIRSDPELTASSQREDQIDAQTIEQACQALAAVESWQVEPVSVENAAAMYPTVDLLQACRLAVTWAADDSWEMNSAGATLRAALRKLDSEGKPPVPTQRESERDDRRARGAAALETLMGGTK